MALTAGNILDRAEEVLLDQPNIEYTATTLLTYLNDGQREIINRLTEAGSIRVVVRLDSGTRQALPTGGRKLLDITRNMVAP
jgi:hypothetical protein